MLWACVSEIPAYFAALTVIEYKTLGRKNSSVIGYLGGALSCFAAYYLTNSYFTTFVYLAKFWANATWSIIYPYTTELYPTRFRSTGLGFSSAASRIGGMIMPWIIVETLKNHPKTPFLTFGIACAIGGLACAMLPYDTTGKALDGADEGEDSES